MSKPLITPELAQELALEGEQLRSEYHQRIKAMWRREKQLPLNVALKPWPNDGR